MFVQVADPVGSGFVESLARPGGNVTGFANFEGSMGGKWVEALKEIAPTATRALILLHPETVANVVVLGLPTACEAVPLSETLMNGPFEPMARMPLTFCASSSGLIEPGASVDDATNVRGPPAWTEIELCVSESAVPARKRPWFIRLWKTRMRSLMRLSTASAWARARFWSSA